MSTEVENNNISEQISLDRMERICRETTIAEFADLCSHLSYKHICQVAHELVSRTNSIRKQLEDKRDPSPGWNTKASSALSILGHKIKIARDRISLIRNNHISLLMDDIGGSGWISSKRLVMIKCLLHMIDHYSNISAMSTEEKSVLDACRVVGDLDPIPKFDDIVYKHTDQSIYTEDGTKVAEVVLSDGMAEEYGFLMASSRSSLALLSRCEPFLDYLAEKSACREEGHDKGKCNRCSAVALHGEIVDLLTELK